MSGYSSKGRSTGARLNEASVQRIRQLANSGSTTRELADTYGITPEAVRRILRWDTWRWVSEEDQSQEQPSSADIYESLHRVLEKAGVSLEEALKREAKKEDSTSSTGSGRLQTEVEKGDGLLAGLLAPDGLTLDNAGGLPPVQENKK